MDIFSSVLCVALCLKYSSLTRKMLWIFLLNSHTQLVNVLRTTDPVCPWQIGIILDSIKYQARQQRGNWSCIDLNKQVL